MLREGSYLLAQCPAGARSQCAAHHQKVSENVTEGSVWHCIKHWCTSTLSSAHSSDLYIAWRTGDQSTEGKKKALKRVKGMQWLFSEERLKS